MRYFATVDGREFEFHFEASDGVLLAHVGDRTVTIDVAPTGDGTAFSLLVDGRSHDLLIEPGSDGAVLVQMRGERIKVGLLDERERAARSVAAHKPAGPRRLNAVMPGIVVDVRVVVGDTVDAGQTLVVLEAMKMQNPIAAEAPGTVRAVHVKKGQAVANGAVLVELA